MSLFHTTDSKGQNRSPRPASDAHASSGRGSTKRRRSVAGLAPTVLALTTMSSAWAGTTPDPDAGLERFEQAFTIFEVAAGMPECMTCCGLKYAPGGINPDPVRLDECSDDCFDAQGECWGASPGGMQLFENFAAETYPDAMQGLALVQPPDLVPADPWLVEAETLRSLISSTADAELRRSLAVQLVDTLLDAAIDPSYRVHDRATILEPYIVAAIQQVATDDTPGVAAACGDALRAFVASGGLDQTPLSAVARVGLASITVTLSPDPAAAADAMLVHDGLAVELEMLLLLEGGPFQADPMEVQP